MFSSDIILLWLTGLKALTFFTYLLGTLLGLYFDHCPHEIPELQSGARGKAGTKLKERERKVHGRNPSAIGTRIQLIDSALSYPTLFR